MSISHRIEPARRLVINIARGEITGEDLISAQGATAADPKFDPGFDQLLDLREAVLTDIPASTIAHLAAGSAYRPTSRRAIVVTDLHALALVRMFRGRTEDRRGQIELFSDLAEAEAWLQRGQTPATAPSPETRPAGG